MSDASDDTQGDRPPGGSVASDPPADTSNQNAEEPSAPHPPAGGKPPKADGQSSESSRPTEPSEGKTGGAGEDSQATGHPQNAG